VLGLGRRLPVLKGTLIDERLVAQQVECSESLVSGRRSVMCALLLHGGCKGSEAVESAGRVRER